MSDNIIMNKISIILPEPVKRIIGELEKCGYEAFAVGGCVRDSIIGITPNDWDICTNADPQAIIYAMEGMKVLTTGLKHGTVTVIEQGMPYEITTYRKDGSYLDGRHPEKVTFVSSLNEDLARRDFTINAMAYHPKYGLMDWYGGIYDIKNRIIRCVGDPVLRFREDALRIMRAIRFASGFGFSIDSQTAEALHKNKNQLERVSAERISEEFYKFLIHEQTGKLLNEFSDIIQSVLPALSLITDKERDEIYFLVPHAPCDFSIRLAALLCQVIDHLKDGATKDSLLASTWNKLRYSNQIKQEVEQLIQYRSALPTNRNEMKRLLGKMKDERVDKLLELCFVLQMRTDQKREALNQIKFWKENIILKSECYRISDLAINGNDLRMNGMKEGKEIGERLTYLLDLVINEKIPNEKKALLGATFPPGDIIE
jgi:tRNA nucleotidyltransferase (CCA-adding enzyme)